ncbi:putative disease resistance protein RGA1 [Magnolia sinica]|uniref:putative disease resistance protein RGA1 n=1 Tax=Magnolia sinica TaxID=86752 RepID=UPI00265B0C71|nr:putative disease resistance protein RGA1 [Magnolia sinica]
MPSLHHLKIVFCPKLKALPRQLPPAISDLEIEDDGKIVWTPSLPPFLERLIINYKVRSSLRPLPVIPNLKHLKITGLKENESLPDGLGQLEALQALEISYCPMLNSLPKELQHLTALKELRLFECPLLKERNQNVLGEDWRTIAHIPNIWMDDEKIQ